MIIIKKENKILVYENVRRPYIFGATFDRQFTNILSRFGSAQMNFEKVRFEKCAFHCALNSSDFEPFWPFWGAKKWIAVLSEKVPKEGVNKTVFPTDLGVLRARVNRTEISRESNLGGSRMHGSVLLLGTFGNFFRYPDFFSGFSESRKSGKIA